MAILYIGGEEAPSPSEMRVTLFDVGSQETRAASGILLVDRVAEKRRIGPWWAHLDCEALADLPERTSETFFEAAYPDPVTMTTRTMTCRCAERSVGVMKMESGAPVWTDIEMTWEER